MALEIDDNDPCSQLSELLQRCDPYVGVVEDDSVTVSLRTNSDAVLFGRLIEALAVEPSGVVVRAAEAAYLAFHACDCVPWAQADSPTRQMWLRAARAALALVREP